MNTKQKLAKIERELEKAVEERTGEPCGIWLKDQIHKVAVQKVLIARMEEELLRDSLTQVEVGSNMQQKTIAHPLLAHFKDAQRTLSDDLEKLGLTYSATPSKIKENTRRGADDKDPLISMLSDMKI